MFKFDYAKFKRAVLYSLGRVGGSAAVSSVASNVEDELLGWDSVDKLDKVDFHLALRHMYLEQDRLVALTKDQKTVFLTEDGWNWLAEDRPWKAN